MLPIIRNGTSNQTCARSRRQSRRKPAAPAAARRHSRGGGKLLRLAIVASVAVSLLIAFQHSSRGADGAATVVQGDVNCSGTADAVDSLQIMLSKAGLSASVGCIDDSGDVNCDDAVDSIDSVHILHFVVDTSQTLEGCSPKGIARRLFEITDRAAVEALLIGHVYPEIDVGLYTADGQQILDGAETDIDTDFYLYEFESELMAGNLIDRRLYGLETLTLFLTEAGVKDNGEPLTDADVLSLLAAKVTAARGNGSMFTWRLVDELGLLREDPLDLAMAGLDPDATLLDSAQIFLALYDLTLGLPGSAAAFEEVHAAAGNVVDLPTKALHDWAAENVSLATLPVEATHWRPTKDSTSETRTFTVTVSFPPVGDEVVLSGPLAGYDPGEFLSGVGGFPVWWYPENSLVPGQGVMVKRATTDATDDSGVAKIDFLPNVECPNGKGSQTTETFAAKVEVQPLIKSIFPPHTELGLMSEWAEAQIQVSHRSSSGSLGAIGADSVSTEAITSIDKLPCSWKGTSHASTHHFSTLYDEVGSMDGTFKFSMTKLERSGTFAWATYEVTSGSATWHAEGYVDSVTAGGHPLHCPFSKGGTESVVGLLNVTDNGSGQLTYSGGGGTDGQDLEIPCGESTQIINTISYFFTCTDGEFPVTGDVLSGSCNSDYPDFGGGFGWHDEFNWNLEADLCPQGGAVTPQAGTCGGTASIPE